METETNRPDNDFGSSENRETLTGTSFPNSRYHPSRPVEISSASEQTTSQVGRATAFESEIPTRNLYLSLIIPAYNEARRLPETLDKVLKWLENQPFQSEVVVVDDGSEDTTTTIVQRLMQQRHPNLVGAAPSRTRPTKAVHCELRLIENPHRGKAYAVRTGMLEGRGQFIFFADADLATPISETSKLLFWLDQGFDVVIGSREGVGARRFSEPYYRHLMGRIFNLIVRVLTNSPFQDTQCGFKAFTRRAAYDLFQRVQLYTADNQSVRGAMVTGFDVEVLFLALKQGYRVKEVPVEWYHVSGSKVNPIKDSLRNFRDVLSVRFNDIKGVYRK